VSAAGVVVSAAVGAHELPDRLIRWGVTPLAGSYPTSTNDLETAVPATGRSRSTASRPGTLAGVVLAWLGRFVWVGCYWGCGWRWVLVLVVAC
jgi:hypothetical protein